MIDYAITYWINHLWAGTFIDKFSELISAYSFFAAVFVLIAIIILVKDKKNGKKIIAALVIALMLHFLITNGMMKGLIGENIYFRERPYIAHPGEIIPLGELGTADSFPSGHVAAAVALLTGLVYYYRKCWPLALIFALLMGFSRIHNGMHYLSDVIFGAIFGIAYGFCAVYLAKIIFKKIGN